MTRQSFGGDDSTQRTTARPHCQTVGPWQSVCYCQVRNSSSFISASPVTLRTQPIASSCYCKASYPEPHGNLLRKSCHCLPGRGNSRLGTHHPLQLALGENTRPRKSIDLYTVKGACVFCREKGGQRLLTHIRTCFGCFANTFCLTWHAGSSWPLWQCSRSNTSHPQPAARAKTSHFT